MNPLIDLVGERVGMIALQGFEHLLQLTRGPFAGRPSHRHLDFYRTERTLVVAPGYQVAGRLSRASQ